MFRRRQFTSWTGGKRAGWQMPAGLLLFTLLFFCPPVLATSVQAPEILQHGRFDRVTLYRPVGTVTSVALFLSGDAGWNADMDALARDLAARGALVTGVSTPNFLKQLADDGECAFADGDLENLSHYIQAYAKLPGYRPPALVGQSAGATLAYATLAQSPQGLFSGALSLDFRPQLGLGIPLCGTESFSTAVSAKPAVPKTAKARQKVYKKSRVAKKAKPTAMIYRPAPHLPAQWIVLQGEHDPAFDAAAAQVFTKSISGSSVVTLPTDKRGHATTVDRIRQFAGTYVQLAAAQKPALPPPPASLGDLPLIEIPAASGKQPSQDIYAVLLSGDGGWAGLDKSVAAALVDKGISVVGFDSLRYFWAARKPEGLASDLDRVLRYYSSHWKKGRALLVGYSQGADVLPFALNRLPATTRDQVALTALMGLGENAVFEFHVTNWVSDGKDGLPILPEVQKLPGGVKLLCLYGEDEADESLCPKLDAKRFIVVKMAGGHHFDGDYDILATEILKAASQH